MIFCIGVCGLRKVVICKINWRNCGNEGIVIDGMYLFCLGFENFSLVFGLNILFIFLLFFFWGKVFKIKYLNIVDVMFWCNMFLFLFL